MSEGRESRGCGGGDSPIGSLDLFLIDKTELLGETGIPHALA